MRAITRLQAFMCAAWHRIVFRNTQSTLRCKNGVAPAFVSCSCVSVSSRTCMACFKLYWHFEMAKKKSVIIQFKTHLLCWIFTLSGLISRGSWVLFTQCFVNDNKEKRRRCWGFGRKEASWWRGVERSGRSYLRCSVYRQPLFQLLMTWCLESPAKKRSNKDVLLPSVLTSSSPSHFLKTVSV